MSQRPTILLFGFFETSHQTFIQTLQDRYRIIGLGIQDQWLKTDFNAELAEDIVPIPSITTQNYYNELNATLRWIKLQNPELYSYHTKPHDELFIQPVLRKSFTIYTYLKEFFSKHPIDLVFTNSDHDAIRRPVVLRAREFGIPTVCMEHGYFGHLLEPEAYLYPKMVSFNYCTDYVNVDNLLEKRVFEQRHSIGNSSITTRFIANGTPIDHPTQPNLSRRSAATSLKLNPNKPTITVAGSWTDPDGPSGLVIQQVELIEYYRSTLNAIRKAFPNNDCQVIIKLHPSQAGFGNTMQNTIAYLSKLTEECGIAHAHMTAADLPAILALSDVVISPVESSILYEAFLKHVPTIMTPLPFHLVNRYQVNMLENASPLAREKFIQFATDPDSLPEIIKTQIRFPRADYAKAVRKFQQSWGIDPNVSTATKSKRICQWIESSIFGNSRSSDKKEKTIS